MATQSHMNTMRTEMVAKDRLIERFMTMITPQQVAQTMLFEQPSQASKKLILPKDKPVTEN